MSTLTDIVSQMGDSVGLNGFYPNLNGGKYIFVDPKYGVNSRSGLNPRKAVRTVNQAYAMGRDGKNDVIVLMSQGDTASSDVTTYLSANLAWAKDRLHLIGAGAPTMQSPRARIATVSTQATAIDPLLTISGTGSVFANFQVYNGIDADVAANGVNVTGERNYFYRVHIAGMGNAKNDKAGGYSLKLTGGGENLFEECVIGLTTTAKGTAANSEILFASATARNIFKGCYVHTFAEAATHQFILAAASAMEKDQIFENCFFINPDGGGATTMTEAISINATQNGRILLLGTTGVEGASDWEASATGKVHQLLMGSDPGIVTVVS